MRKTFKIECLLIAVILSVFCNAQNINPDFNDAFLQDEVAVIKIEINEGDLSFILDQENWGQSEVPARFIYETSFFTDTIENIGFRLRGNTSLQAAKKSFKVSFNSFSAGNRWKGLKKLNLNGEHNDVSLMRSKVCWDLLRDLNLPSSRSSYVRLYINDEFKGVYLNLEHIDDLFSEKRFSEGNGNLYKCTYPANLQYEGSSAENYQIPAYELKTNTWNTDTYGDLAKFITDINLQSENELECEIHQHFNIRDYIKSYAAEVLIGHWDGYAYNNNNFYLYSNLSEERIEWIHYDLDNTLGIDWFGTDWSQRNIYDWMNDWDERPLAELIMENEEWRNLFSNDIQSIINDYFNVSIIAEKTTYWKDLIEIYVQEDTYYSQDYGFEYSDFINSDDQDWGGHVTQGILEYVDSRATSALNQLESLQTERGLFELSDSSPLIDETSLIITALADQNIGTELTLYYQINGLDWLSEDMYLIDNGLYEYEIPIESTYELISYYVQYDGDGLSLSYPCEPITKSVIQAISGLVINELMADNQSNLADENGDYDDWAELYNTGGIAGLGQYYISDNPNYPNKWQLPDDLMTPESYLLLWCDDDPEEGSLHTNFKLDNNGDSLFLFTTAADGYSLVDYIMFEEQTDDLSFGRSSDGAENWQVFETPTPNSTNLIVSISESNSASQLNIYPNPTIDFLHLNQEASWVLRSLNGKRISSNLSRILDLTNISSGTYILEADNLMIRVVKL